jgi:hypothetical protein
MEITNLQDEGNSDKNDEIISSFIPPFKTIRDELTVFYQQLQISLEEGVRLGTEYFTEKKLPTDVYLLNQMIRYHTKRLMQEKAEINLYEMEDLSNNGLAGNHNGYHIRIFKGTHGNIPIPNSDTKRDFFCQQLELNLDIPAPSPKRPNVFFLWDLDKSYSLTPLRLVCPEYAEKGRDVTRTYYDEIVKPVFAGEIESPVNEVSEGKNRDIRLKGQESRKKDTKDDNSDKADDIR